jgi:hypothetical protein
LQLFGLPILNTIIVLIVCFLFGFLVPLGYDVIGGRKKDYKQYSLSGLAFILAFIAAESLSF